MRCYIHDPELPFRPTGLVFALLAHRPDVRRDFCHALEVSLRIDDDVRCVFPQAEELATRRGETLAAHVLHVMGREWRGHA